MAEQNSFLWKQYRYALLRSENERIAEIGQKLLDSREGTAQDIQNARLWLEQCQPHLDMAAALRSDNRCASGLEADQAIKMAEAADLGKELLAVMRDILNSTAPNSATASKSVPTLQSVSVPQTVPAANEANETNEAKAAKGDPTRTRGFLLNELEQSAAQNSDNRKAIEQELLDRFPEAAEDAKKRIRTGELIRHYKKEARRLGQQEKSPADLKTLLDSRDPLVRYNSYLEKQMRKKYDEGVNCRERNLENERRQKERLQKEKVQGKTAKTAAVNNSSPFQMITGISTPEPSDLRFDTVHKNFVGQLPPAESWTILIDETGEVFDSAVFKQNAKGIKGRIVAVLVPDYCSLPNLKAGFHAAGSNSFAENDQAVQSLLSFPCGILGIPVESLHQINCDLWLSGIDSLLDLIVRLIPMNGNTSLQVLVEQRGTLKPDHSIVLQNACNLCLNRLSRSNPYRAESITLTGNIVKKDAHPWLGYADAAAHCWTGKTSSEHLIASGWKNTCLLDSNPDQLSRVIDQLEMREVPSANLWTDLLDSPDAKNPNSVVSVLLRNLGEEVQYDPNLWKQYLDCVQRHLYSKAIELNTLGRQIGWLKQYTPEDAKITPRLRLVWLTAQLAEYNHQGRTDVLAEYEQEFKDLCAALYSEDAPLTCQAALHLAVEATDNYDFEKAFNSVKDWVDRDEAIPGRKFYGQVLSTVGQVYAFMGAQNRAVELFREAIGKFEQLSDKEEGDLEISQTSSYLSIASMDCNPVPDDLQSTLEAYLGRTLEQAAEDFSGTEHVDEKYAHHVFLRYLAHVGNASVAGVYLSRSDQWKTGDARHPWELIQFYRGLLTTDPAKRNQRLRKAYEMVANAPGTLAVIACVILGSLYYYDPSCKAELEPLTQTVINSMPNLGAPRVAVLQNQLIAPIAPLELAKAILPFNFR